MPQITERAALPTSRTTPVPAGAVAGIPAAALPDKQTHKGEPPILAPAEVTAGAQDGVSPKIAALARREAALQNEKRQFETQRQALAAEREQIRKEAQAEIRARLKSDPFGLLGEEGLTVDHMIDLQAKQPTPEAQKLTALEQRLAKQDEDRAAEQKQNYEAARTQVLSDVKEIVNSGPEFEVMKALGIEEEALRRIEETYKTKKVIPDYATVCKEIEAEYLPLAVEIAKLASVQKAMSPTSVPTEEVTPPAATAAKPQVTEKQPAMTTLSNRQAAGSKKSTSWAEHRQRLIAIAEGKTV